MPKVQITESLVEKPSFWPVWYIKVKNARGDYLEGKASSERAAEECRRRWETELMYPTGGTKDD